MENLIETIAEFLEFSDEKLADLSAKNQSLKLQKNQEERREDA